MLIESEASLSPCGNTAHNCIFCEIMAGRAAADVIFEDKQDAAFLPLQQEALGHVLIVPKAHRETLREITLASCPD
jgi:histidine triad (HIT) family protein